VLSLLHANVFGLIYCKIKGRVVDDETGVGIPDVNVQAHRFVIDSPQDFHVLTDSEGYFTFSNLKPGEYALNYIPLFPYTLDPQKSSDWTDYKRSFILSEGEIKNTIHRLKKGGRLIVTFNSSVLDPKRCGLKHQFLDRIEGAKLLYDIETLFHKWRNPKFVKTQEGNEYSGLAEGQYIASFQMYPKGDYYHEVDYDVVGIPKIFNISKNKDTVLNLDFVSKATLILDLIDKNGNTLNRGNLKIYNKIDSKSIQYYYCTFLSDFSPYRNNENLKPMLIKKGEYLIEVNAYPIPVEGQGRYSVTLSDSNFFRINIEEDEVYRITCKILMKNDQPSSNTKLIH